jgi:hypothetical protein
MVDHHLLLGEGSSMDRSNGRSVPSRIGQTMKEQIGCSYIFRCYGKKKWRIVYSIVARKGKGIVVSCISHRMLERSMEKVNKKSRDE